MPSHTHSLRNRIYIGRLPSRATNRDVESFFRGYGKITDINLRNGYGFVELDSSRDTDDAIHDLNGKRLCSERIFLERAKGPPRSVGRNGGDRYETFDRNERNRRSGRGRRSFSRERHRSRSRSPRRRRSRSPRDRRSRSRSPRSKGSKKESTGSLRIEVSGMPEDATLRELEDLMSSAGKVVHAELRGEGKAFVEFSSEDEVAKALETLSSSELKSSKLTLVREEIVKSKSEEDGPIEETKNGDAVVDEDNHNHGDNGNGNGHAKAEVEEPPNNNGAEIEAVANGDGDNNGSEKSGSSSEGGSSDEEDGDE